MLNAQGLIVIDTHPHLLAKDLQKYPVSPIGGVQSEWSKGMHVTGQELIRLMDMAGVSKAVLVQASTFHGFDNSYVADESVRFRDRFIGVCCVDPLTQDAPSTLEYWIETRNMKGVRIFSSGSTLGQAAWFDHEMLNTFWQKVRELSVPVNVQMAYDGLGMLKNVMDRFPEITIILDHLGSPSIEKGPPYASTQDLFELASYSQLFLKFTNVNLKQAKSGHASTESFFGKIIELFGADRLMWGSNFPSTRPETGTPYEDLVAEAERDLAFLDEESRSWLFGRSALRLYPTLG